MTRFSELGSLDIFSPSRISGNLASLREHAAQSCGEVWGRSTWDALRFWMYPELHDLHKENAGVQLVSFYGNDASFLAATEGLVRQKLSAQNGYDDEELALFKMCFSAAVELMNATFPSLSKIFPDLISYVVLAKKQDYAGGTVSSRVGMIWLAPERDWTVVQWAEMLVHEFIHNILFVEDMVRTLFLAGTERLAQEDVLSQSAIRQTRRGYDKSYHSAFVSIGLIRFHVALGDRVAAHFYLDPLTLCVSELLDRSKLLSDNGKGHLEQLAAELLVARELFVQESSCCR